jgi:AraC family transcriptional regulator of arabinose operon
MDVMAAAMKAQKPVRRRKPEQAALVEMGLPAWLLPQQSKMAKDAEQGHPWPEGKLHRLQNGALAASRSMYVDSVYRRSVTIMLSITGDPFELEINGYRRLEAAVLITPMTRYTLAVRGVGMLMPVVYPNHQAFRMFKNLRSGSSLRLERDMFEPWAGEMAHCTKDGFEPARAQALFDGVVGCISSLFPGVPDLDPRLHTVMRLVEADVRIGLETLAEAVELSYDRLSHLFAEGIGLPLKSYQLWLKTYRAMMVMEAGCGVSEAAAITGFADLGHLCRSFRDAFGMAPSTAYSEARVFSHHAPSRDRVGPTFGE